MYYCLSGNGVEGWEFTFNGKPIHHVHVAAEELGLIAVFEQDTQGNFIPHDNKYGRRIITLKGEVRITKCPAIVTGGAP